MPNNTPPGIIWREMLQAVYWFDESLQLHVKQAGYPPMNRTQSLILLSVAQGYERPAQIAQQLGMTRQAVHQALKDLQNEGLISVADDPNDRRAKRVYFSRDDARDEMRCFATEALQHIEQILAKRVGKQNFDTFRKVLQMDWGDVVTPEESVTSTDKPQ